MFFIEIVLYNYINYSDLILPSSQYVDLVFPFFYFVVLVVVIIVSLLIEDAEKKKEFRNFSIFVLVGSFIILAVIFFLSALGHAYQH